MSILGFRKEPSLSPLSHSLPVIEVLAVVKKPIGQIKKKKCLPSKLFPLNIIRTIEESPVKKTERKGVFAQQALGFRFLGADCESGSLLGWEGCIKEASTIVQGLLVSLLVQAGYQRILRKIWAICHLVPASTGGLVLDAGQEAGWMLQRRQIGCWKRGRRRDECAFSLISSPGLTSLTTRHKK